VQLFKAIENQKQFVSDFFLFKNRNEKQFTAPFYEIYDTIF